MHGIDHALSYDPAVVRKQPANQGNVGNAYAGNANANNNNAGQVNAG